MPSSKPPKENAVEVPHSDLAPETLRNLAEEFVTRDGTDYGAEEKTLDEKVAGLMGELEAGEAKIYFEAETGTINIVAPRRMR
ncbi:MAG: YheU family protein [Myxococcota bacterium]|nr:YheU family protein [Myxococcota bacterium]